ncbi:MAG: excinuclease ABC subunit UvrB [bacterium]
MEKFELVSKFQPSGDQPRAIQELVEGLKNGDQHQTLLGVTGSGKTFTVCKVIEEVQRPTLVISHNKTLAAQLYAEFKTFFPNNAVEFFISYYDYYQPEAYLPRTDTFIEKDFSINDEIDRLRLRATSQLASGRRDVILIASVSCIYSIGKKEDFESMIFTLHRGVRIDRQDFIRKLIELYYSRNDFEFQRGTFRVRGDVIDIIPAYENQYGIRVEFFGDEIERISHIDSLTGVRFEDVEYEIIYPAKIFVTSKNQLIKAMADIKEELIERLEVLRDEGKLLEAQRLEQRTQYDLEMMREVGFCSGIENYSMHMSGRTYGDRPSCIFDFFPEDYLIIVDESHASIPQLRAMYAGDRSRKTTLVEHGFRLPSALENRPLRFDEFESIAKQTIYVSATPGPYELDKCDGVVVEQIIRPTGLLDPEIEVRPIANQVDDLLGEITKRVKLNQRVLVTTLTKKMAENLTEYFTDLKIKCEYIHADVVSIQRVEIIRKLRLGDIDVIVGVNLLREGLDLPEVTLVAVLDADKEGFLRSERSLLQVAGRTARNVDGKVIFYGDKITNSMKAVIDETNRRRIIQQQYNIDNNINPETIYKTLEEILSSTSVADITSDASKRFSKESSKAIIKEPIFDKLSTKSKTELIEEVYIEMKKAAKELDFEKAAMLRDELQALQKSLESK